MRFLIFSIRTLLLRFNHRPGRIFFAVEKITQLETEGNKQWKREKIILDCDPGHDDAIAIMMAAKHPAIDLLGITIVAGNQTLDKTLINGLNVFARNWRLMFRFMRGCRSPLCVNKSLPIIFTVKPDWMARYSSR